MNKLLRIVPVLLGALLAAGCTPNGGAIFAIIEQEEETIPSNLPDSATVVNVFALASGVTFVAVSPTLYRGTQEDGVDNEGLLWDPVTNSGLPADVTCRSAVLGAADRLYAVFAGATAGLYYADAPAAFATDANPSLEWTSIDPGIGTDTPQALLDVAGEILLVTRTEGVLPMYGLYRLDTGTHTASTLVAAPLPSPVTDGASLDDATYWVIAADKLLSGPVPGTLALEAEPGLPEGDLFGGIHADRDSGRLHLSTSGGQVLYREGGVWTASDALTISDSSDTLISFTDFISFAGDLVYVGTEGRGIFRLTDGLLLQTPDVNENAARLPNQTINELYAGTIRGMIRASDCVFLMTAGSGLWHQVATTDLPDTGWRWE